LVSSPSRAMESLSRFAVLGLVQPSSEVPNIRGMTTCQYD
jgi:hypothetical protein